MSRLVIPKHARAQCRRRINGHLDLRQIITPYLGQLEAQVPPRGRAAWMDAPGGMVPVFERASRHGALVVVTVLREGYGLSQATKPVRLGNRQPTIIDPTGPAS
jgi:hypothetical protein